MITKNISRGTHLMEVIFFGSFAGTILTFLCHIRYKTMTSGPREIVTPFRPIPLDVPEGMKPNEFFNSTENLNDLVHNNGLLQNPEGLLLYRKALGHSNDVRLPRSSTTPRSSILDPLGRPVRRTQVPDQVKNVWNRMNQIIIEFMLEQLPRPGRAPGAGRRSQPRRDLAADLARRAEHPHAAQPFHRLRQGSSCARRRIADANNPNLTDGGQHSLFQAHMRDVYRAFFDGLDLQILQALRVRRLPPRPDRLSAGPAELGDPGRRGAR